LGNEKGWKDKTTRYNRAIAGVYICRMVVGNGHKRCIYKKLPAMKKNVQNINNDTK